MCGIAGYLLHEGAADAALVNAMCDRIVHRGPDDSGVYTDGPCSIGMRRLSIIDLSSGHQPISNEDGSVWIVFNGEIYNYHELRQRLIAQGHQFRTNSDTETLVHLYEQDGLDGLASLRGMFAFCLWDARNRELILVRDRFGKKPLYYAETPDGFYFASEMKCLALSPASRDLDKEALRLYFLLGYIPEPYSPYLPVRKLMPGCWLRCRPGRPAETGRYWRLPEFTGTSADDTGYQEAQRKIRDVFDEAVRMRMEADVPLGAFLSGGIDSSLVVASMARQSQEPVRTFSIGFEEASFNELPYARMLAEQYKTQHHEILVKPDSISLVMKLVGHFDEPFADSSAIPTYLVSEFAARHVTVALSGDGGDELFGGYDSLRQIQKYEYLDRIPVWIRRLLSIAGDALPYSAYGKNYLHMIGRPSGLSRYIENHAFMAHFARRRLLQPEWLMNEDAAMSMGLGASVFQGADTVAQAMYFEAAVQLPGDMLTKVDRASMAASLEVRCPMMDHRLGELAASIPYSWKIRNGAGKQILIDAMKDRLPAGLLNRPKQGFAVPLAKWFRTSLKDFIVDHLESRRFLGRGFVRPGFVKYLLDEHMKGRRNNHSQLYALLMLELWCRRQEES